MDLDLRSAQADMRRAYYGGATGLVASGLVWLVASAVALRNGAPAAVWSLLVGGMLITPLAMLLARLAGRSGAHAKGNPLAPLAAASTVWLIASLPLAYAASRLHVEWFFPAMLLVIGSRYLVFHTLYGDTAFWPCGLALLACGVFFGGAMAAPAVAAATGGAIELAAAMFIGLREHRRPVPAAA